MSKSKIEWTEDTWNVIVGCSILSPGCIHCYAMSMAARINERAKTAARERLRKGLLTGRESAWTITEAGRIALSEAERNQ